MEHLVITQENRKWRVAHYLDAQCTQFREFKDRNKALTWAATLNVQTLKMRTIHGLTEDMHVTTLAQETGNRKQEDD